MNQPRLDPVPRFPHLSMRRVLEPTRAVSLLLLLCPASCLSEPALLSPT